MAGLAIGSANARIGLPEAIAVLKGGGGRGGSRDQTGGS